MNSVIGIALFLYTASNVVFSEEFTEPPGRQRNVIDHNTCSSNSPANNHIKKLANDIVCGWNSKTKHYPLYNKHGLLYVTVKLIPTFFDIMEDDKMIHVHGALDLTWKSEKLRWEPKNYGFIEACRVNESEFIYWPSITYDDPIATLRLVDQIDSHKFKYATIHSNGSMTLRLEIDLYGPCRHNYKLWPSDEWTCTFFVVKTHDDYTVYTNEFDPKKDIDSSIVRRNLTSWKIVTKPSDFVRAYPSDAAVIELTIIVQRDVSYYRSCLIWPGYVLLLLSLTSFWQGDQISDRLMGSMFIGAVQIVFILCTLWLLRDTGSKDVILLDFYVASFLTSFIGVLMAIVNSKLMRKTVCPPRSLTNIIQKICQITCIGPVVSYFVPGLSEVEQFEELAPSNNLEWKVIINFLDKSVFALIVLYFIICHLF